MQQTKKFKMADAISPYLAVSCGLKRKKLEHCSFKFASPTTRWSGKFVNFKLINGISLQFSSGDAKATLSAVAYAPESNTEAIYQAVAAMQALNIKGKKPGVTTHHL